MRICDSGMTPRICRLVICGLKKKIWGHLCLIYHIENLPPGLDPCGQGIFTVWPLGASQYSPLASTLWHVPARQPAVVVGGDSDQSKNKKSACCCDWLRPDQSEDCTRKLGLSAITLGVPCHGIL
jgi:hypothetical protein